MFRSIRGLITQRNEEDPASGKPNADSVRPKVALAVNEDAPRSDIMALIPLYRDPRDVLVMGALVRKIVRVPQISRRQWSADAGT